MAAAQQRHFALIILLTSFKTLIIAIDLPRQFEDGFDSLDYHKTRSDFIIKKDMSYIDELDEVADPEITKTGSESECVDKDSLCRFWNAFVPKFCFDPSLTSYLCDKTCGFGACAGSSDATKKVKPTKEHLQQLAIEVTNIFNDISASLQENERKVQKTRNVNCENDRSFELLLDNLQNFCDLKHNIISIDQSKLDDVSIKLSKSILSPTLCPSDILSRGPAIETMKMCASEIQLNVEEETFYLEEQEAIQPEINVTSDILNKLSDIETMLTNLEGLKGDAEQLPDVVFAEIIKISTDLYREKEIGITDLTYSKLDKYYLEISNIVADLLDGEIIPLYGLSQSLTSVRKAITSLSFAKAELIERQHSGEEFKEKRIKIAALNAAVALALRVTRYNNSDSLNISVLQEAINILSDIHDTNFITENKLKNINEIEGEIVKAIEEGKIMSTLDVIISAIIDHILILQSDIDVHKDEVLILAKVRTELKTNYLIKQIRLTIENIIHKIGNSATMTDETYDTNNKVTNITLTLTAASDESEFIKYLSNNLNTVLSLCNSILENTVVGRKINGINNILSLVKDIEIEIKILEVTAREIKDTLSLYDGIDSRTNLVSKIIQTIATMTDGKTPSIAQLEIIDSLINHLKTIMVIPYNELFPYNIIPITGLEILSHNASSMLFLLQKMFFVHLDTRKAVIQKWKLGEARYLLHETLTVIENHVTDRNIHLPVNDIRMKNLLFEIKTIQYEEITAEQLLKIRHLIMNVKNMESLYGLKYVTLEINEIIVFIDESLVRSEEEKREKQRLSSHTLILFLFKEAYQYLEELTQNTLELPNEETSEKVEDLMMQITANYRNAYSFKYSSLQDLRWAIDNFKIFLEENHDRGILNIATYTKHVRHMIDILQNVLNVKNNAGERYDIINQASKLVSSITLSFECLLPTEYTIIEKSFRIIDKFDLLFSNFGEENYIFSGRTIQILEEYNKIIEYLKIDTVSIIGVLNINNIITKADSVIALMNQTLVVENSIYESFKSFSRGKTVLDLIDKILFSLMKIRSSVKVDNTLSIHSIIQPILNINDDLPVVTDEITTSSLLNILTDLFKIEDRNAKTEDINQIIENVQNINENIQFYVANFEVRYISVDSDQISSILTLQVHNVSTEFDILMDSMKDPSKFLGENRIEFENFFNILENWNKNFLEIDFKSIVNFKEEWNKVSEFISFGNEDTSITFGRLQQIYSLMKQISSRVNEIGMIRKELTIFQTKSEILDEKVLIIQNILEDIATMISSKEVNSITYSEIEKDVSKLIYHSSTLSRLLGTEALED